MTKNKSKYFPVSVIVPMRNSVTTVIKTLQSLRNQNYPIREIIVIDNASKDKSVRVVEDLKKKVRQPLIRLIKRRVNYGVGASYNLGAKLAKADYLVFLHSDSQLPTKEELTRLMKPLLDDPEAVASASFNTLPEKIWLKYPFWEKCLLARAAGKSIPALNGKFDALRKRIFLAIGGFDEVNYGHDIFVGGEDADLGVRLTRRGKIVQSSARVIHLHYLDKDYTLANWIANRKLLARSYGRFLRIQWRNLSTKELIFAVKLLLVFASFVMPWPINFLVLLIYASVYLKKMYLTPATLTDPRIILLPFITIFLIYYETFWMIESFLYLDKSKV
ncbi:MAG: glycosyltransferase family 2 protein [Patescibacteria group bacterium]